MRVLFVEDNDDLREVLTELLLDEGLEVVACASGEAAQQAFAEGGFDLLLTDLSLPGMSGRELAQALRTRQPSLWVAFLSGTLMKDRESLGPRVRSFLKPLSAADLKLLVADISEVSAKPEV